MSLSYLTVPSVAFSHVLITSLRIMSPKKHFIKIQTYNIFRISTLRYLVRSSDFLNIRIRHSLYIIY